MERSVKFNNAGVDCLEAGHHKVAWDLFKGALEVKLAVERSDRQRRVSSDLNSPSNTSSPSTASSSTESSSAQACTRCNKYVQKAEEHYSNLDVYVVSRSEDLQDNRFPVSDNDAPGPAVVLDQELVNPTMSFSRQQRQGGGEHQNASSKERNVRAASSFYTPFLYCRAMKLRNRNDASLDPSALSTRRESATIIFNLALVDHMKNRSSEQAVALYELAMTLLTGDTVDALGIALVNNIGVWCYENGEVDGAITCMGHLSTFIGAGAAHNSSIDSEEREGLHSNILWLLNPPFAASPAA